MENSFLPYSHLNGVPQESKLATYMNRQNAVVTPVNALVDNLSSLVVDDMLGGLRHTPGLVGLSRNGESPSTSTPVRASPVGVSILNDAAPVFQPESQFTMPFAKAASPNPDKFYMGFRLNRRGMRANTIEAPPEPPPKSIRQDILEKNALLCLQPDPEYYPGLPAEVGSYTDLIPLEHLPPPDELPPPESSTFKATHNKTGISYCLRRMHGFRVSSSKSMLLIDIWKKLSHANIVKLREVFTTRDFGDNSIVLVYDYHPGSQTLWQKHLNPPPDGSGPTPFSADPNAPAPYSHTKNALLRHQHQQSSMLPENLLWNYIIQMTSALRAIHASGLACRTIDPSKVIIASRNRLRLSCAGVADVLTADGYNFQALIPHQQQEDLSNLGKLVLVLACRSMMALENVPTALDLVGRTYSSDLKNLISYLLNSSRRAVTDLMPMIGARFYVQLDEMQNQSDEVEAELSRELDNSRLFRLVTKLGTINDRPEFGLDTTWSETGDRYMLKLFRDYLFHQVTEDGRPWLDMSHIVQCLNKLEAGTPEKVCLMSRDEQSILVVTYTELKHCLEQSFSDLLAAATSNQK